MTHKKGFFFIAVAALTFLWPLISRSEVIDKIVAIVNDDIVTLGDVQRSVQV